MDQYKIKDAGFVDGIVKFIIYTKIKISWTILKLEDKDEFRWVSCHANGGIG